MKMLKNNTHLSLLLLIPLVFTGCKWNKKQEVKCKSKKVALYDKHGNFPLAGDRYQSNKNNSSKPIDAFVITDEEDEFLTSPQRLSTDKISHSDANWKRDKNAENEFEPVLFAFDSSEIRAKEKPKLEYDIARAKEAVNSGYTVVVEGHSDSKYISAEYNIAKSERRAQVGAEELKKAGVPESNIKVVAYGDSKRAVPTNDKEERNRRIEFVKVSCNDVAV